jgi:prepilin-type N-terminal cleavage/methylation domain-containing protein
MRTARQGGASSPIRRNGSRRGFTIPELLIVMAIFLIVTVGLIYAQAFGMSMFHLVQCKLSSTSDARSAVNQIRSDVLEAKRVLVGSGDIATFAAVPLNTPQIGNAIQLYPTTNPGVYVRYFLDTGDNALKRVVNGSTEPLIVAEAITNRLVFQAEDSRGNVLTNDRNNRVIRMTLEFYQLQYPMVRIGPGYLYDYYRLQTKMTRRSIE